MVGRFREGEVTFTVPSSGQTTKTWYRISGALTPTTIPLIILHGGPGMTSEYLWNLEQLTEKSGITTVIYDQLGNGRSTHLPERNGDTDFWTEALFIAELENLLEKLEITGQYDILGQSWGGMLGARYATSQPARLRKLIISNSPASIALWNISCDSLRAKLPQDVQDTLSKHEKDGTTDSKEYHAAVEEFYKLFLCRIWPFPKLLTATMEWAEKDPTVYGTMNGPSEFFVIGSLKDWTVMDEVHKIKAKTLVINGEYDEAQDSCTLPFVERIEEAKWKRFEGASHCTHLEMPEEYMEVVGEFLRSEEA